MAGCRTTAPGEGPSDGWEGGGIQDRLWTFVGWNDGSTTLPDPDDPDSGYAMSQGGTLQRWNLRTGEIKEIRAPGARGLGSQARLRVNFTPGFALDPFAPGTLYAGSQFVHKSTDRGDSWTVISPDLTTNNPEWQHQAESGGLTPDVGDGENFTTIIAIAPSPLKPGLLWVGTDDGRLQVTRDGGGSWTSVEAHLPSGHGAWVARSAPRSSIPPPPSWCSTTTGAATRPRTSSARTTSAPPGRASPRPDLRGHALSLEQDPVDRDLLFLGTSRGLWVSLDGGRRWMPWRHGIPAVPVADLAIHPRDHDLVIATFGRGLYVLDDVRPLRGLTPAVLAEPLHLFAIPDARQHWLRAGTSGHGANVFHGEGRPYGALLTVASAQGGTGRDPGRRRRRARPSASSTRLSIRGSTASPGDWSATPSSSRRAAPASRPGRRTRRAPRCRRAPTRSP